MLTILAVSCAVNPFTSPAIEVEALVKTYGEVEAVRSVSFTVARGEVFGFLGPNGAGKSTTINMLCTLTRPTSGTARVSGYDVTTRRDDVRRHIDLVFQDPTLDGYLTAAQNLRLRQAASQRRSRLSSTRSTRRDTRCLSARAPRG